MLTIHHAPGTRGFRVIWLCEELALPYALRKVDFSAAYRASEAWRRMNPVGKVPVMTADGVQMFESGAMLQYLLERHAGGRLQPPREAARRAGRRQRARTGPPRAPRRPQASDVEGERA
jgi:glutathione S-transferase